MRFLFHSIVLLLAAVFYGDASKPSRDWLGPDSVVMVCGAASFLGSEVSLALHTVHAPKKLILVDELADIKQTGGLSLMEFQRQRLFRVLQSIANSDTTTGTFYRVDLRPEVPEFVDSSVVPMLDYIVKEHPDITHILYLPEKKTINDRVSGNPRAVLMHAILDQLSNWKNVTGNSNTPQFTYASSYQVYSGDADAANGPYEGREDRPITRPPTSMEGSAYLLDEILAESYYKSFQVDSIGLRMFTPYGPFDTPSSTISKIADNAINTLVDPTQSVTLSPRVAASKNDYVYIDNAVDAIMIAMQVRAPINFGPLFTNIGSGRSVDIRGVVNVVKSLSSGANVKFPKSPPMPTKISELVANTDRAKQLLGWEPTVSLEEGIRKTLGWHFDRMYPQGSLQNSTVWKAMARAGRLGCDLNDLECLRGAIVYPCTSECAHPTECHSSFWDQVALDSRQKSAQCSNVWYTLALEDDLEFLPSVKFHVSQQSQPQGFSDCNFAFVSDKSPLFRRTQEDAGSLKHGFWTLVPVSIFPMNDAFNLASLGLLPKISPGMFFDDSVDFAIFTEPYLIVENVQALLAKAKLHPYNSQSSTSTALLAGMLDSHQSQSLLGQSEIHQKAAYRMIHIKSMDFLAADKDGFDNQLDASFLVHRLSNEDAKTLRCDVSQEVWSWNARSDQNAWQFVGGLHDMWSQVMVQQGGQIEPWWHDEKVESVPLSNSEHRRLQDNLEAHPESDGIRRAPLQYHHLLQNKLANHAEEEKHAEESHHFDEHGVGVAMEVPVEKQPGIIEPEMSPGVLEDSEEDAARETFKKEKWLGVLSSGQTRSFIHLVKPEDVGVVDLRKQIKA